MKIYIVIPAYNEATFIGSTLESLIAQTYPAQGIIVVNDQSTDDTAQIVGEYAQKYPTISLVNMVSQQKEHSPGSKVVQAFNKGFEKVDQAYDIICKFDADLIFPANYLERIVAHFNADPQVGMAGGFCVIKGKAGWELENLTSKDHIRGALKAYRKSCFLQIGMLKTSMGWDTVDELLAQYHGWKIKTDEELLVRHLKPTGGTYTLSSKYKQGEAFYKLGYGLWITLIASAKLAFRKKDKGLFFNYIAGYFKAKKEQQAYLVSKEEARYIRKLRWKKMKSKFS